MNGWADSARTAGSLRSDDGTVWHGIDPNDAWEAWEPSAGQPWDIAAAAHLFRRAAFGATWRELEDAVQLSPQAVVGRLLDPALEPYRDEGDDALAEAVAEGGDARRLAGWWLLRMAAARTPLRERTALFWHGHFATSAAKVGNARVMLEQLQTLRRGSLGPFGELAGAISRDPAMLIWLDCRESRKTQPNENFARELMELFCLGLGEYSEQDIRELARCFTGSEVRYGKFRFNRFQFDDGEKRFLGRSGLFDRQSAVQVVVEHPATARFLAHKLLRYFVADTIPADAPLVGTLADRYRAAGLNTAELLRVVLCSRLFHSPQARGARIGGPVELAVGLMRAFRIAANGEALAGRLEELGQLPLYPPSVKGWNAGTTWINAQTLAGRMQLVHWLTSRHEVHLSPSPGTADRGSPEALVRQMVDWLLPVSPPQAVRERLESVLPGRSAGRNRQVSALAGALAALPEFHLH